MPILGITGGIASGKSSFAARLSRRLNAEIFDADAVARELLEKDAGIQEAVVRQFGTIDRERLRKEVFTNAEKRKALEAILHPPIRARWTALRPGNGWLLLDIPLLYETGAEKECDIVVVVACREETQIARIVAKRGLTAEMAARIIAAQTSLASKAARADYVVWNDAPEARLDEQAELLAEHLTLWTNN